MTHRKFSKAMQAGILAAALTALPVYANATAGVKVGVLTCHEASGWGLVFESTRDLKCVYSPASGPSVRYTGHISKFGVDIGYQGAAVMLWTVVAPELHVAPDALAGDYVGATGGAAVGVGLGANVLVGGSNKSISLQPVSFEGGTGLNVAAGVASLTLQYQPTQQDQTSPQSQPSQMAPAPRQ